MFQSLGQLATRYWLLVLAAWTALFVAAVTAVPTWTEVAVDGELRHLPESTPTRAGAELVERAFPGDVADSSVVIVVHRRESRLLPEDKRFVRGALLEGLRDIAAERGGLLRGNSILDAIPHEIRSLAESLSSHGVELPAPLKPLTRPPTRAGDADEDDRPRVVSLSSLDDVVTGPMLVSADGHATLVVVELTSGFLETRNGEVLSEIENLISRLREEAAVPEGLQIDLSGSAAVGTGTIRAVTESTRAVRRWAIWIAVALLLIVFRAPIAAVVPLVTMYVAVEVALGALAWGAYLDLISVFDGLPLYLTVIVYGAGVDYSLFLLARHEEELRDGWSAGDAVSRSLTSVGTAIAASAGTEIVGIGLLASADFGKFQQAGAGIAFGLVVLLIASLTLTPSILYLTRQATFWPQPLDRDRAVKRFSIDWLSAKIWRSLGGVQRRYPGTILVGALVLMAPMAAVGVSNLDNLSYGLIAGLPADCPCVRGTTVLRKHFDSGLTGPISLLLKNDEFDFSSHEGIRQVAKLTERLRQRRERLHIADIHSVSGPLGHSERSQAAILDLASKLPLETFLNRGELVVADLSGMSASEAILQEAIRELAYEHYVSHATSYDGTVTRLTLIPSGEPFELTSIERMDVLEQTIRQVLPRALDGSEVTLLGATASLRDIREVAQDDWQRIRVVIPIGVCLVLLLMLRRPVVSAYLVLTVIFSFLITFGVTHSVFQVLHPQDFQGIEWTVPVLLFTLLVAVGEDYSVLLVSRTEEERKEHPPTRSVTEALVKTGGLISGAGLIMAGTFSALLIGGTMASMRQLGFALCFGVLLDTFVVRPILVPSFLDLLARWQMRHRLVKHRPPADDSGDRRTETDGTRASATAEPTSKAVKFFTKIREQWERTT